MHPFPQQRPRLNSKTRLPKTSTLFWVTVHAFYSWLASLCILCVPEDLSTTFSTLGGDDDCSGVDQLSSLSLAFALV